jgi:hypothetical protein
MKLQVAALRRNMANIKPAALTKGIKLVLASDDDGDTPRGLEFSLASDIVELVVLTADDVFLQTLRGAVGKARRLWHVPSPDKVSDLLVAGEVGILVLDIQTLNEPAEFFVSQIKRQFPDLVIIVAGMRDAEIALAGLISAGTVYRFIHKPMSPARARLFAEAAVRKYGERRRHIGMAPDIANVALVRWLRLGVGAIVVLAAVATATWALLHGGSGDGSPHRAPAAQAARP